MSARAFVTISVLSFIAMPAAAQSAGFMPNMTDFYSHGSFSEEVIVPGMRSSERDREDHGPFGTGASTRISRDTGVSILITELPLFEGVTMRSEQTLETIGPHRGADFDSRLRPTWSIAKW